MRVDRRYYRRRWLYPTYAELRRARSLSGGCPVGYQTAPERQRHDGGDESLRVRLGAMDGTSLLSDSFARARNG